MSKITITGDGKQIRLKRIQWSEVLEALNINEDEVARKLQLASNYIYIRFVDGHSAKFKLSTPSLLN